MKQLEQYFNSLSQAAKIKYASKCGTSVEYIKQLIKGFRNPSPALALKLEECSKGKVNKSKLIWGNKG